MVLKNKIRPNDIRCKCKIEANRLTCSGASRHSAGGNAMFPSISRVFSSLEVGGKVYSQAGWGAMAEIASGSATEYMQMISEVP